MRKSKKICKKTTATFTRTGKFIRKEICQIDERKLVT